MGNSIEGVVKGSGYILATNAIVSVAGALFWILVAPIIGDDGVGYASSAISLALLLGLLLGLGQNFSVLRLVPVLGFRAFLASLFVSVALGSLAWVASYRASGLFFGGELLPLSLLVGALSFISVVSQTVSAGLIAIRSEKFFLAVSSISQALRVGLGLALALAIGVRGVLYAYLASMSFTLIASTWVVASKLGFTLSTKPPIGEALKVGVSNYPNLLATGLIMHVAVLSAALVSGDPGATGGFYIALNLGLVVSMIPGAVAMASLPRLSVEPGIRVWPVWRSSIALTAPILALMMTWPREILSLFGEGFVASYTELFVVLIASPLVAGVTLRIVDLNARGLYGRVFAVGASRLGSMLILVPILGGMEGAVGIAIAYSASIVPAMLLSWDSYMFNVGMLSSLIAVVSSFAGRLGGEFVAGQLGGQVAWLAASGAIALAVSLSLVFMLRLLTPSEARAIASIVYREFMAKPLSRAISLVSLETLGRGFILGFMALLVIAAVQLAMGEEAVANKVAEYAYYLLVAGVVVLLVETLREKSGEDSEAEA
ncbi:MAG: hypothetical protein F7C07_06475 [Desulfurococcales archaeon]|nr:hypothetical protein [Desulfurococcales archaeon]